MAMATLSYIGNLVVTSCWCGIGLAIPEGLYNEAKRQGAHFDVWCPLGHKFVYSGETEAEKFERLYNAERDRSARIRAERDQTEASLRATKGVVTKMRKRAIVGACQFCHRTFSDVARHVQSKHAAEVAEVLP